MNFVDETWIDSYKKLEDIDLDNFKKHPVIKKAMNPEFYNKQVRTIAEREDLDGRKIVEIGCGYGGLCKKLFQRWDIAKYTLVDSSAMLKITKHYLDRYRKEFVSIDYIENISKEKYDFLISNHCLSETTSEYRSYIYEHIFPKCYSIFIIDSDVVIDEIMIKGTYKLFGGVQIKRFLNYKDSKLLYCKGKLK